MSVCTNMDTTSAAATGTSSGISLARRVPSQSATYKAAALAVFQRKPCECRWEALRPYPFRRWKPNR